MKKAIIAAALSLAAVAAHSETRGFIANKAGGQILFDSRHCTNSDGSDAVSQQAFIVDADGTRSDYGCFMVNAPFVEVHWQSNGANTVYRLNQVTLTDSGEANAKAAK